MNRLFKTISLSEFRPCQCGAFPPHVFQKVVLKLKINYIFIFTLLCGTTKGFMKAFKVFIKPFKATQRCVKIKKIFFFLFVRGRDEKGESDNS